MTAPDRRFRLAITADFYHDDGTHRFRDMGLSLFDAEPAIEIRPFLEHRREIGPDQLAGVQGVIVLTPGVTAASLARAEELLAVARFGVGYDSVDVAACTASDVVLIIATGAVDRPVAEATVAWMLALTHQIRPKDLLSRAANWDDRTHYMGCELRDRTLGVIGLGGIGRALVRLLDGFGMNPPIAYDPFLDPAVAASAGVRLVGLDELMATADFVSVNCPLTSQTRGLIGPRQLGLMKPEAYLINTARGGIVDERALYDVLQARRIAGAAVDVFEVEPFAGPPRLAELDNVLLAPHSIAWTHELFRDIGRAVASALIDLAHGRLPRGIVNRDVLDRPSFQQKWARLRLD